MVSTCVTGVVAAIFPLVVGCIFFLACRCPAIRPLQPLLLLRFLHARNNPHHRQRVMNSRLRWMHRPVVGVWWLALLALRFVAAATTTRTQAAAAAAAAAASKTSAALDLPSSNADFAFLPTSNLTRVAFGSCHKLKYAVARFPNLWSTIWEGAQHPQVWLWTGDAVYPPSKGVASLSELDESYQAMKAHPQYAHFVSHGHDSTGDPTTSSSPLIVAGTYDDHDYGGNDLGRKMPDKAARAKLFWDFVGLTPPLPSPSSSPSREGVYYSMNFGTPPHQVKLIVLDTRYFRDDHCLVPSIATHVPVLGAGIAAAFRWLVAGLAPVKYCDSGRTVLGETQWDWLEQQVQHSTAALHIIVSSIQVLTTNPAMEGWGHYPSERRKLLQLLSHPDQPRTLLLSGDVHHGELLRVDPVWEITSSGLTHDCGSPIYGFVCQPLLQAFDHNRATPHAYCTGRNFGSLIIDWDQSTVEVKVHPLDDNDNNRASNTPVLTTGPIPLSVVVPDAPSPRSGPSTVAAPTMDGHLQPIAKTLLVGLAGVTVLVRGMHRIRRNR